MILSPEVVARITSNVSELTGLYLEACEVSLSGHAGRGFRLAGLTPGKGIQIVLGRTMSMSFVEVLPEDSAGAIVRAIGRSIRESPEAWRFSVSNLPGALSISLTVNGEFIDDILEVPDSLWRAFSLELVRRERLVGLPSIIDSLSEVAASAISLVLSCLFESDSDKTLLEGGAGLPEGAATLVQVNRYERNPWNRQRCISHYGNSCWACDMSFESVYGTAAKGYIEVHHRTPVSQMGPGYLIDPVRDLVPLCSNCHSAVHRQNPPFEPAEIRAMMGLPEKYPALPECSDFPEPKC